MSILTFPFSTSFTPIGDDQPRNATAEFNETGISNLVFTTKNASVLKLTSLDFPFCHPSTFGNTVVPSGSCEYKVVGIAGTVNFTRSN